VFVCFLSCMRFLCCYLFRYLVYQFEYGVILLLLSILDSFLCIPWLLIRNMWYLFKLFKNFSFLASFTIVSVFCMFPCVCPLSDICQEYPVFG
jgi:hypothetical protein